MRRFDELFAARVVAILRSAPVDIAVAIADQIWDAGGAVEVTLQDDAGARVLELLIDRGAKRGGIVGAGTVTTPVRVRHAAELGAAFTVAPGVDPAIVEASHAAGVPHLPGVATATEVQQALALGCTWQKAFPASTLTPGWFRHMRAPFPEVRFVATGGVSAANAELFLEAGVDSIGVGNALEDPAELERLLTLVGR